MHCYTYGHNNLRNLLQQFSLCSVVQFSCSCSLGVRIPGVATGDEISAMFVFWPAARG